MVEYNGCINLRCAGKAVAREIRESKEEIRTTAAYAQLVGLAF